MRRKGYVHRGEFWEKEGESLRMVIDIFSHFQDLTPVLIAQLKKAGIDASFRMTSDFNSRLRQGTARAYLSGNFSSMRDPYFALRQYHSRFVQPTGASADNPWRWRNAKYDELIDQMGQILSDDPVMEDLYYRVMDIWLDELPSIPLVQWPHRIPHNETYWTNWPTRVIPISTVPAGAAPGSWCCSICSQSPDRGVCPRAAGIPVEVRKKPQLRGRKDPRRLSFRPKGLLR